jgi:hypothetical protein
MFFSVFDSVHPGNLIILSLVGERLKQFFRESARTPVWVRPAARGPQSLIEDGRSGSEAIATAALAANRHRKARRIFPRSNFARAQ